MARDGGEGGGGRRKRLGTTLALHRTHLGVYLLCIYPALLLKVLVAEALSGIYYN